MVMTIRVALGDTSVQRYTLVSPSGGMVDLTAATVEVDVVNIDTAETITTIECACVPPTTTGVVSFPVEDATGEKRMSLLFFKVLQDGAITTYPVYGEQGFLVY